MRGYETEECLVRPQSYIRYESPCGVMRLHGHTARREPLVLRIPMRGYEQKHTRDDCRTDYCYESPCGVMR